MAFTQKTAQDTRKAELSSALEQTVDGTALASTGEAPLTAEQRPPPQPTTAPRQAVAELSIEALCDLTERFAESLFNRHMSTVPGLIAVTGRVDSLPASGNYSYHYDVVISGATSKVYAEFLKSEAQAQGITKGSYVRAVGRMVLKTYQGQIKPRLVASQIEQQDSPDDVGRQRQDHERLEKVFEYRRLRHAFPIKDKLTICVICSQASQVLEDFVGSIKEAGPGVQVEPVFVSITNRAALTRAIQGAQGDVLALIRGGGPEDEFSVFNSDEVLAALGASKLYRLVALGHSQHQTLSDLVADYSADTPTAAGHFIREQLLGLQARLAYQRRMLEAQFERSKHEVREAIPTYHSGKVLEQRRETHFPSRRKPRRNISRLAFGVVVALLLLAYAMSKLHK